MNYLIHLPDGIFTIVSMFSVHMLRQTIEVTSNGASDRSNGYMLREGEDVTSSLISSSFY